MSRGYMYLCGTPEAHCTGANYARTDKLQASKKGHGSSEAAYSCYRRWLVKILGYRQLDSRGCFAPPDGGPVLILSKKSRFGGRLRMGKENTRFMYDNCKGVILY